MIQSYCCPDVHTSPHPYTVHISNSSYARSFKDGFVTIMWTPSSDGDPEPNHCIPLVPHHQSTGFPFPTTCSLPVAADRSSTCTTNADGDIETPESSTPIIIKQLATFSKPLCERISIPKNYEENQTTLLFQMVHGTKGQWLEQSMVQIVYGTNSQWYERSMGRMSIVQMVYTWYE